MSTIVRADATGALTLPAELCRSAGVEPGAALVVEIQSGQIVLSPTRPSIWERIAARGAEIPSDAMDKFPPDGAAQIDHYLYGHPKRPE